MASLRDVARRAGVSVATASRVANGFDGVRAETRTRVQQAMRDLLYVPPSPPGAAGAIGLLIPELENPVFPWFAQALEKQAAARSLATILCNTGGAAETEADYVHMLLERRVEGMVFISSEATDLRGDHAHYPRLVAEGARLVFVNSEVAGIEATSIRVDEHTAGRLATEHLLELGHRRVGFVAGPEHAQPTRDKSIGRELALKTVGLGEAVPLVAHGDWGFDGGCAAMRELLALGPGRRPTGVICSSDVMAIGALRAAREAGLRIPEQLSIVGFDGIETGAWAEPPLTTLEQPIADMAASAVEALQTLFTDRRALPELLFKPKLRVRGSTTPPEEGAGG